MSEEVKRPELNRKQKRKIIFSGYKKSKHTRKKKNRGKK